MIENLRLIKQEIKKATNEGRRPLQRETIKEPLRSVFVYGQQVKTKDEALAKDIFYVTRKFQYAKIPCITYQDVLLKVESLLIHFMRVGLISDVGKAIREKVNG